MRTEVRKLLNWAETTYRNASEKQSKSFRKFLTRIEQYTNTSRLCKAIAKNGAMSSVCPKKEAVYRELEEQDTPASQSSSSTKVDNNFWLTPQEQTEKGRRKIGKLRWAADPFKVLKSHRVAGIVSPLLQNPEQK